MNDDGECTRLIDGYMRSRKVALRRLNESSTEKHSTVRKLQEELEKVADELMSIELRQVEKFEKLIDDFDNSLNEFKNGALEMQQLFFRKIEDMEEKFSSGVKAVAADLIERLAREELAEDYLDEEAMALVVDKDACMQVVSTSHDIHVGRIVKREDEARANELRRYQDLISGHNSKERNRNRDHILQIHDFVHNAKQHLHSLLAAEEDEEDEN
jgi:vacuolar-type H+-ATPase subunit I/STV1